MKICPARLLLLFFSVLSTITQAQTNQTILNGQASNGVNFGAAACKYNWANDKPEIGLPASGSGDIPSFVAVNNSTKPIIATITATPAAAGFAYVADTYLNIVSVINLTTNLVVATIPVGLNPHNVEISADGSLVYVVNYHGGSISVISTATNKVISTLTTDDYQLGFTVSADGSRLYTICGNGKFLVINTATNTVIKSTVLNLTSCSMCFSKDGKYIFIASNYGNDIAVFNTETNVIENTIPIGVNSNTVSLSADGTKLYVSTRDNRIKIVDIASRSVSSDITIPYPYATMLSPDGKLLYVTTSGNSVSVINLANNTIVARYPAGQYVEGISLNGDGSRLYVMNQVPGTVSVINTTNNTLITDVRVGTNPYSMGHFVYSCSAKPITFTITINPTTPVPKVITSGVLASLSTVYGKASETTAFKLSGENLSGPVELIAPEGFELSTDNNVFGTSLSTGNSGNLPLTTVYIRLKSNASAGNYAGQIQIKSGSEIAMELAMPLSEVFKAPLLIVADTKTRFLGAANPLFTASYYGWVNGDTTAKLSAQPTITCIALSSSAIGAYPIVINGAAATNYEISYIDGYLYVVENPSVTNVPGGFSPNNDGVNDFWDIKNLSSDSGCTVNVFNRYGTKVFSSIGYKTPWDGTSKGKVVVPGVYFYVITLKEGRKISGSLTVIR
ncbi:gliding motility-associated C-terminal domain-containing protein [Pedobacter aquatilis]|uniref:T9SS type B sorting domain-containing protein n=1 Tax=Pedobacter aquatilis TaxID=351343 RepID=UPI00293189E6|nr:gliding motility-associated C-terminal domain-containing protein [Pedobacter aquatilis]